MVAVQGLLKSEQVLSTTYTAEATLYLSSAGWNEDVLAYNYQLDETRELENARRIVLSDSVAGQVKRALADQDSGLIIASPFPYDSFKANRVYTNFVYIDATSTDPEIALQAANQVAELATEKIAETLNDEEKITIYEQAIIKSGDNTFAAEPGEQATGDEALNTGDNPASSALARIDKKNLVIALFLGLFGSAFIFCVYEILNRKVRTAHDAETLIGIPVIAQIPVIEGMDSASARQRITQLASDIQVLMPEHATQVISVASMINAQNSTDLTQALSAALTQSQLSVTLIQARGVQSANLETVKQAVDVATEKGDLVLIDSGALIKDSEATLAVAASSAVLLVTRQQEASSAQVKQAIRQLQIADTPLLGIVLLVKKGKQA